MTSYNTFTIFGRKSDKKKHMKQIKNIGDPLQTKTLQTK